MSNQDKRGFRIESEKLLDWYVINPPNKEYKSEGYKGKWCQDRAKKIRESKEK